jgi:hypothetical protein
MKPSLALTLGISMECFKDKGFWEKGVYKKYHNMLSSAAKAVNLVKIKRSQIMKYLCLSTIFPKQRASNFFLISRNT